MTAALATQARAEIGAVVSTALGTGWKVYLVAPPTPVVPSVTLVPDTPYMRPTRLGTLNYELRVKLLVAVDMRILNTALNKIESAVETCMTALAPTVQVMEVSPPQVTDIGAQGSILVAEVSIIATIKE